MFAGAGGDGEDAGADNGGEGDAADAGAAGHGDDAAADDENSAAAHPPPWTRRQVMRQALPRAAPAAAESEFEADEDATEAAAVGIHAAVEGGPAEVVEEEPPAYLTTYRTFAGAGASPCVVFPPAPRVVYPPCAQPSQTRSSAAPTASAAVAPATLLPAGPRIGPRGCRWSQLMVSMADGSCCGDKCEELSQHGHFTCVFGPGADLTYDANLMHCTAGSHGLFWFAQRRDITRMETWWANSVLHADAVSYTHLTLPTKRIV